MNTDLKLRSDFLYPALKDIDEYLGDPNHNIDKESLFKLHTRLNDDSIKSEIIDMYNYDLRVQLLFCEDSDFGILSDLAKNTSSPEVLDELSFKLSVNPEGKIFNYLILLYGYIFWNPVCTEDIQLRLIDNVVKLDRTYFIKDIFYNDKTTTNILLHIAKLGIRHGIANHPNVTLSVLETIYELGERTVVFTSPKCTTELRELIIDEVLDSNDVNWGEVDYYLLHYGKYGLDPEKKTKLEIKRKKLEADIIAKLNQSK
jgi:hypothetical protein